MKDFRLPGCWGGVEDLEGHEWSGELEGVRDRTVQFVPDGPGIY